MPALGKATLAGALAGNATLDSVSQLIRTITGATCDVTNLEQANRSGDLMRALWARGCVVRFIKQAPSLLAAVPHGQGAELRAQVQEILARAEMALENGPKISPAAREAADRGNYSRWEADLAPWHAKAQAQTPSNAEAAKPQRTPSIVHRLGRVLRDSRDRPSADRPVDPVHTAARDPILGPASAQATVSVAQPAQLIETSGTTAPATVVETASTTAPAEAAIASAPAAADHEHQIAARGTAGSGGPLPYLAEIQKSFGHHDVSSIRAHIGGAAAVASDALGAQAYAYGNAIAFASAPDLHTAAHEAAHAVQQRRGVPRSLHSNDAYERHADLVADRVVRGLPVAALLDRAPRGGGATAVVQRKKTSGEPTTSARNAPELTPKAGTGRPPELEHKPGSKWPVFAQTGLPYIVENNNGVTALWVVKRWFVDSDNAVQQDGGWKSPARARELLTASDWVEPEKLEFAASSLRLQFVGPLTYFVLGARAAWSTGLPPGKQSLVERGRHDSKAGNRAKGGLFVTVPLDDAKEVPGHAHEITTSELQRALQAAADFTSLPFDPDGHAFLVQGATRLTATTGNGVVTMLLTRENCGELFGPAAYNAWLGEKSPTREVKTPKLKLENFYKSPVPGRLTHYADIVEHDENIRLEVLVDWPSYYPNSEIYDVPPMVTPSKSGTVALLQCQWSFERLDGKSDGPSPKGSVDTVSTSLAETTHRFRLAPGEKTGLFAATCHARADAYFEPTTIPTRQIVVLSAAEAMSQQQSKAFADLGADNADRKNDRWTGDVRPGFKPSPAAGSPEDIADPTAHDRAAKRDQLRAAATYLGDKPANAEAVAAIDRELKRQDASETLLAGDRAKGWQSFQIRGTYLSRTEGVPSGPLDLHGTVHTEFHHDPVPGDGPSTTDYIRNDKIRVQIRDLSRRFGQVDFEFTGIADTFDGALHDAFEDLAITYPTGMVSIEAEQIRHRALRQWDGDPGDEAAQGPTTGKVIGFQRSTETTWKTVKGVVWDPIASVGINLGAIALMVLVPGSAAVVAPMLIVYNSVPSIDHIKTKADSGTLTALDVAMSTGEIALNVLPLLSRAKPLTAGWFAVETANWGGRIALMGGSAFEMARELQATHVAALAQEYQQFLELQKTSLPSDPGLAAAEAHIRAKAAEVDGEISRQFTEQVKSNAIQIVVLAAAGSVVHHTSAKGRTAILERLAKRAAAQANDGAAVASDGPDVAGGNETAPGGNASSATAPEGTEQASSKTQHQAPPISADAAPAKWSLSDAELPPRTIVDGDKAVVTGMNGEPLTVFIRRGIGETSVTNRRNSDGTFSVSVGQNVPADVASRQIARELRELASTPRQQSHDLDQLYAQAAVAQHQLGDLTRSVANELQGTALVPDKVKGRDRAMEKISTDYEGEVGRVTDLARSTIVFGTPKKISEAKVRIEQRAQVVRVKDRFATSQQGYRDIMMNLRMPNGHIVEIQLHLKAILDVKNGPGHTLYEQIRSIDARLKRENRTATPEERAKMNELNGEMRRLYDEAYNNSLRGTEAEFPTRRNEGAADNGRD